MEKIALKMATEVYDFPRSSGNEKQRIIALDYRSKVEIECYTELSEAAAP